MALKYRIVEFVNRRGELVYKVQAKGFRTMGLWRQANFQLTYTGFFTLQKDPNYRLKFVRLGTPGIAGFDLSEFGNLPAARNAIEEAIWVTAFKRYHKTSVKRRRKAHKPKVHGYP